MVTLILAKLKEPCCGIAFMEISLITFVARPSYRLSQLGSYDLTL